MNRNYRHSISTLLILSCGLLGILVPGGSIETRNFSHLNPVILGCFNTFLTLLVMISILIIYYLLQDINWAYIVAAICGFAYFMVHALDLAEIFPTSPIAMSQTLFLVEVVGLIVSLPLIFLSVKRMLVSHNFPAQSINQLYSKRFIYFTLVLSIASLGIIIFATESAMGI